LKTDDDVYLIFKLLKSGISGRQVGSLNEPSDNSIINILLAPVKAATHTGELVEN